MKNFFKQLWNLIKGIFITVKENTLIFETTFNDQKFSVVITLLEKEANPEAVNNFKNKIKNLTELRTKRFQK